VNFIFKRMKKNKMFCVFRTANRRYLFKLFLSFFFLYNCANATAEDFYSCKCSYSRNMANEWGTICLPFDVEIFEEDDFTIYKLKYVSGTTVLFEPYTVGTIVYAGTPCLIHKDGDLHLKIIRDKQQIKLSETNEYSQYGWSIKGTFTGEIIEFDNSFYMAKNKLWHKTAGNPLIIRPFSAWLEADDDSYFSRSFNIGIVDMFYSGIPSTETDIDDYTKIYDFVGRQRQTFSKGINIIVTNKGTKKIWIK